MEFLAGAISEPVQTTNWLNTSILGGIFTVVSATCAGAWVAFKWIFLQLKEIREKETAAFVSIAQDTKILAKQVTEVLTDNALANNGLVSVLQHIKVDQRGMQIQIEKMKAGDHISAAEASMVAAKEYRELDKRLNK